MRGKLLDNIWLYIFKFRSLSIINSPSTPASKIGNHDGEQDYNKLMEEDLIEISKTTMERKGGHSCPSVGGFIAGHPYLRGVQQNVIRFSRQWVDQTKKLLYYS